LRYKKEPDGPFMNNNEKYASPPWTSLRELEQVSLRLESEEAIEEPEFYNWLSMLVNPGSSLGGSRPKASVLDNNKRLWIAKFPSRNDTRNAGGWEILANELAVNAGLKVARCMVRKLSGSHYTFLTQRFDRTDTGDRIHFASAMTMLGYNYGNDFHEGVSYLELADFLSENGANVENDLEELWRRIVFNIFIANTDDHLRNHGFILTERGWILSPAFDINPNDEGTGLSLNISLDDNSLDPDLPLEIAGYFRLNRESALKIIDKIRNSVSQWGKTADKYKLQASEKEVMAKIFNRFL
jgi:serine/threonine-protein kinase HipA